MTVPQTPPSEPTPEKRAADRKETIIGGIGCLFLLAGGAVVVLWLLGSLTSDPTFAIAVIALIVGIAALGAARRRR